MGPKARRYILVPLVAVAFMTFWRLITGRTLDLSLVFLVIAICWTSAFFAGRRTVDVDAPPTRKDLLWAIAGAPFAILGLGFWGYQLVTGFDDGILLVARGWTVTWTEHPFGFVFTSAMYLIFAALMLAVFCYSWFTIREWIDERRGAPGRS